MKERLTEEQECPDKEGGDEVDGLEGVGEEHSGRLLKVLLHPRSVPQVHQGGCCSKRGYELFSWVVEVMMAT